VSRHRCSDTHRKDDPITGTSHASTDDTYIFVQYTLIFDSLRFVLRFAECLIELRHLSLSMLIEEPVVLAEDMALEVT